MRVRMVRATHAELLAFGSGHHGVKDLHLHWQLAGTSLDQPLSNMWAKE